MALSDIESIVNDLFESYMKEDLEKTVESISQIVYSKTILNIIDKLKLGKIKRDQIITIANIFSEIGKICNVSFDIFESDGITQKMSTTSFYNILETISKTHTHQGYNNKGTIHNCAYHIESLFVHLHLASLIVVINSILKGDSQQESIIIGLIALLHDIGKPSMSKPITINKTGSPVENAISFPFHGEIGAGIIGMAWNPNFNKFFTIEEWNNISRVVACHMCSYHETDPIRLHTLLKWDIARLESVNVKNMLLKMSYGDFFGSVRDPSVFSEREIVEFMQSRKVYKEYIDSPFNLEEIIVRHNIGKNTVIVIRGMSGSGKSSIRNKIVTLLGNENTYVVERDNIICKVVADKLGETFETRPIGPEYARYMQVYNGNKKQLSQIVTKMFTNEISKGFTKGKIVIVDSVITYFDGFKFCIPPEFQNAFIVAIDVVRNKLLSDDDANRLGDNLKKQIDLHGKRSVMCWLNNNAIDRANNLTPITTSSEKKGTKMIDPTRPTICHVISWNEFGTIGDTELFRQLEIIKSGKPEHDVSSTDSMGIVEYWNYLYNNNLKDYHKTCNTLSVMGYLVNLPTQFKSTPFEERLVRIIYVENNRFWKAKWARESRGVILYLNDSGNWIPIKYALQRGAEILTGMHVNTGITESQDVENTNIINPFAIFDDEQQIVMNAMVQSKPIEGYLSSKVDGSLLVMSCYRGEMGKLVNFWIDNYGDKFAKSVRNAAKNVGCDFIPVFSTQTTFFAGDKMIGYMTTALVDSMNMCSYEYLCKLVENDKLEPYEIFDIYGEIIFEKLRLMVSKHDGNILCFSFEAVCKNRTSPWINEKTGLKDIHTELAVSYPISMIRPLGLSICTDNDIKWVPHFTFTDSIKLAELTEPMYWVISHAKDIEGIMDDLSKVIRQKITIEKFLELHPIANKYETLKYIDWEGFVFLYKSKYMYSKVKTIEYYKCHKYRPENIKYLMELSTTASEYFPVTRIVYNFFKDLKQNLVNTFNDIFVILNNPNEDLLNNTLGVSTSARKSYEKQNSFEIKARMIINGNNGKYFINTIVPLFHKYFKDLNSIPDNDDKISVIKAICMSFQIWNKDKLEEYIDLVVEALLSGTVNSIDTLSQKQVKVAGELFNLCFCSTNGESV